MTETSTSKNETWTDAILNAPADAMDILLNIFDPGRSSGFSDFLKDTSTGSVNMLASMFAAINIFITGFTDPASAHLMRAVEDSNDAPALYQDIIPNGQASSAPTPQNGTSYADPGITTGIMLGDVFNMNADPNATSGPGPGPWSPEVIADAQNNANAPENDDIPLMLRPLEP